MAYLWFLDSFNRYSKSVGRCSLELSPSGFRQDYAAWTILPFVKLMNSLAEVPSYINVECLATTITCIIIGGSACIKQCLCPLLYSFYHFNSVKCTVYLPAILILLISLAKSLGFILLYIEIAVTFTFLCFCCSNRGLNFATSSDGNDRDKITEIKINVTNTLYILYV